MIVQKDFLNKLKDFGLNSYEAKLWTALLSRGVATAGELSDIANVPRSRSYDVLESLERKGFVVMKLGKPIKYIAVPPQEVLERVKKNMKEDADERIKRLEQLKSTDVLGRPYEGKGHVVDSQPEPERQVVPVLPRQGRQGHFSTGKIDPLPVPRRPPLQHPAPDTPPRNRLHGKPHGPVVQQDEVPRADVRRQARVVDAADRCVPGHVPGGQGENGTALEDSRSSLEAAKADLGSLQVLQNGDMAPLPPRFPADGGDSAGVPFVRPVGKIEPGDGHPAADQVRKDGWRRGSGTDRADDLGGGKPHRNAPFAGASRPVDPTIIRPRVLRRTV